MKHRWKYLLLAVGVSLIYALSSCGNIQQPLQAAPQVVAVQEAAVKLEEALVQDGIAIVWSKAEFNSISEEVQLVRIPTSDDAVRIQAVFLREQLTSVLLTDIVDPEANRIVVGDYFTGRVGAYQIQLLSNAGPGAAGALALAPTTVEIPLSSVAPSTHTALELIRSQQIEVPQPVPNLDVNILSADCDHLRDHIEDAQRGVDSAAVWLAAAIVGWEAAKVAAAVSCVVPGPPCVAALATLAGASAAVAAATYAYNNAVASLESAREAYAAAGCS